MFTRSPIGFSLLSLPLLVTIEAALRSILLLLPVARCRRLSISLVPLFTFRASVLGLLAFPHILLTLVGITSVFPHVSLTLVGITFVGLFPHVPRLLITLFGSNSALILFVCPNVRLVLFIGPSRGREKVEKLSCGLLAEISQTGKGRASTAVLAIQFLAPRRYLSISYNPQKETQIHFNCSIEHWDKNLRCKIE